VKSHLPSINVVGGGLAGCEAALQLARFGLPVVLHEMRPATGTPAHQTGALAEIVCSNSLKSTAPATASGLLKDELSRLGCFLLADAQQAAVPAGAALAVDRDSFSAVVTRRIEASPLIRVVRGEVDGLPADAGSFWILATGPLTSDALQQEIGRLAGQPALHFFDAIAPTVTAESLDLDILFRAARYDRGTADYLNAPFDEAKYRRFHTELVGAERATVRAFDRASCFDSCLPVEIIAESGPDTLAFGPLRPVGLNDPRTGRRPFAVAQLRQENREASLYGLVGFQTQLTYGEQRRVFRLIPGLARAEFVRLGQLHRNFYLDTPRVLQRNFALPKAPHIRVAGQITGVEGYVESIASGLWTAWQLAGELLAIELPSLPSTTICGALLSDFLFDDTSERLSPMNANFGVLPHLGRTVRPKRERKLAYCRRALEDLDRFLADPATARLLAASRQG